MFDGRWSLIGAHIKALVLLPGTVTIIVPSILLFFDQSARSTWGTPAAFMIVMMMIGSVLLISGLFLLVATNREFFYIGSGTLAPWSPPLRLVVSGIYRHVRNPMITGVLAILLGEAIVFGSVSLLIWFSGFLIVNLLYIPFIEEPSLERRFGTSYKLYKENVPRWIPRVTPWNQPTNEVPQR